MDDALALLRLQLEWGADEAIGPDPVDRLEPLGRRPNAVPRPALVAPLAAAAPDAREPGGLAQAETLADLRTAIAGFDGCALRDTASNLVFAEGDSASTTLVIGEPPGRDEDRGGHPFAGAEGQLLDQMLASIGLSRTRLMLTPLLPWRPPGGRPPSATEIAQCLPFLHRLVAIMMPRRIALVGATAARALLPRGQSRQRGPRNWTEISIPGLAAPLPLLVLPGLSAVIKNPMLKREVWAGLRLLRRAIDRERS